MKFFQIVFDYIEIQEDFLNISFYISVFIKKLISFNFWLCLHSIKFMKDDHLIETENKANELLFAINERREKNMNDEFQPRESIFNIKNESLYNNRLSN